MLKNVLGQQVLPDAQGRLVLFLRLRRSKGAKGMTDIEEKGFLGCIEWHRRTVEQNTNNVQN